MKEIFIYGNEGTLQGLCINFNDFLNFLKYKHISSDNLEIAKEIIYNYFINDLIDFLNKNSEITNFKNINDFKEYEKENNIAIKNLIEDFSPHDYKNCLWDFTLFYCDEYYDEDILSIISHEYV